MKTYTILKVSGEGLMELQKAVEYDCMEIGNAQDEHIKVLIRQDVTASIRKRSRRLIGAKSFGLLIGNKYKDKDYVMVYIEDAVAIGNIEADRDNPIFNDKKWIKIKERVIKNNPGKEIVGWYRARSGWGAMITKEDQWLHQNFFDKPWQVIYLFDNKYNNSNVYYWHQQGSIRLSRGYYKLKENVSEDSKKKQNKGFGTSKLLFGCAAAAVVLSIGLYMRYVHPFDAAFFNSKGKDTIETEPHINDNGKYDIAQLEEDALDVQEAPNIQETLPEQDDEGQKESSKLKEDDIEMPKEQAVNKDTISEDTKTVENENTEEAQNDMESIQQGEDQKEPEANREANVIIHIIKRGETLNKISEQYYGDPSYGIVLGRINRISNYSYIRAGDYLIIPSKEEIERWK